MGRLILGLGIAGLLVAGCHLAGLDGLRARSALDAARRENGALRARQEALREQALDLAQRLAEGVARRERALGMAGPASGAGSGRGPRLPARDAGDEALLAWLTEQSAALANFAIEPAAGRVGRSPGGCSGGGKVGNGARAIRRAAPAERRRARPAQATGAAATLRTTH